ncbi:hypothetical protein AAFF_G00048380 [Aldrovandia affinis]|uniref:Uncharacterized protein n=1 Tax=Aldrovandia affinis TaxID=143900 RepID=A0AAD7S1I4_9TELE|nr:hypothetical protein AAFF_G00048380 [Aldrovandia affinis]
MLSPACPPRPLLRPFNIQSDGESDTCTTLTALTWARPDTCLTLTPAQGSHLHPRAAVSSTPATDSHLHLRQNRATRSHLYQLRSYSYTCANVTPAPMLHRPHPYTCAHTK